MTFPQPEHSRGQVNRAGEILRAYAQSTEPVSIEQLDEWNWAYKVPCAGAFSASNTKLAKWRFGSISSERVSSGWHSCPRSLSVRIGPEGRRRYSDVMQLSHES